MANKKIAVVTGAEGFIGSSLVRELIKSDWKVIALHRPGANLMRLAGVDVTLRACNIMVPSHLALAIPENAHGIFHLAADLRITHRRSSKQMEVNVDGTRNVLHAAIEKRCHRFLFTSSMGAFGMHPHRIDETTASNAMALPIHYFQNKYLGEIEVEKAIDRGLDAVIMNPSNVAGPRDIINIWATYIGLVYSSNIPAIGPGASSFCHVREVARSMVACIERGKTGERYLLGGADTTFFELGKVIQRIVGGHAPRIAVPILDVPPRSEYHIALRLVAWRSHVSHAGDGIGNLQQDAGRLLQGRTRSRLQGYLSGGNVSGRGGMVEGE